MSPKTAQSRKRSTHPPPLPPTPPLLPNLTQSLCLITILCFLHSICHCMKLELSPLNPARTQSYEKGHCISCSTLLSSCPEQCLEHRNCLVIIYWMNIHGVFRSPPNLLSPPRPNRVPESFIIEVISLSEVLNTRENLIIKKMCYLAKITLAKGNRLAA